MRLHPFGDEAAYDVDAFGSREVRFAPIATLDGRGGAGCMRYDPGGVVGRHPAVRTQLLCVVSGRGWVAGADGERQPIEAGTVAVFGAGEEHESGSDTGMTAIVVEVDEVELRRVGDGRGRS